MYKSIRSKATQALGAIFRGSGHDVSLDQNGIVTLKFSGDAALTLEVPESGTAFHIYAPVMLVPFGDRLSFLSRTMSLNLFGIAVPVAWLALDREEDRLLLCATLSEDVCDDGRLANVFEDMLKEAGRVRALLSSPEDRAAAETPRETSMVNVRI